MGHPRGDDHNVTMSQEEDEGKTDVDEGTVIAMRRNHEGEQLSKQGETVQLDPMRIPNIIDPILGQQARKPTKKGRKEIKRKAGSRRQLEGFMERYDMVSSLAQADCSINFRQLPHGNAKDAERCLRNLLKKTAGRVSAVHDGSNTSDAPEGGRTKPTRVTRFLPSTTED